MTDNQSCCRLCGSNRYIIIGRETQNQQLFTIIRCLKCSLVCIAETFSEVSPEFTEMSEEHINDRHIWLQSKHKELAFSQCLKLVHSFNHRNDIEVDVSRLLDVGCGTGGWLEFAKAEYECYGFDASPAQSRYARQSSPNVRCATSLSEYKTQFNDFLMNFDLITLWDVLEHIRFPVKFLTDLSDSLSPNGLLFASVPAAVPMVFKNWLLPIGWPKSRFSWNPREHVAYYSPKTLRILCQNANLKVLRIGAVAIYRRPMSMFEFIRRLGFWITRPIPNLAPQIYVLAKTKRQT